MTDVTGMADDEVITLAMLHAPSTIGERFVDRVPFSSNLNDDPFIFVGAVCWINRKEIHSPSWMNLANAAREYCKHYKLELA